MAIPIVPANGRNPPKTHVSENLKTLRLLHQVLMFVAAAVLAFALRPEQSVELRAALNELSTLQQVSFAGWFDFIKDRYKSAAAQNETLARRFVESAGLKLQGRATLDQPVVGDIPPPITTAKLLEFDTFIAGSRRIGTLKLDEGDQQSGVDQLKRNLGRLPNATDIVRELNLSGGQSVSLGGRNLRMIDPRNSSTVTILGLGVHVPNDPVSINTAVAGTISSDTGPFAMDWLRGDEFGHLLIDEKSRIAFPHLKVFWDRVAPNTINEATVFFQQQLDSIERGSLSFFGIPVQRSLAVSAGPAVCFSILLFLGLHVRHFRRITTLHIDEIRDFPWVSLFPGKASFVVNLTTLIVLPTIANAWLLAKHGHWDEGSTLLGLGFASLMLATSIWTNIEIRGLRRELGW